MPKKLYDLAVKTGTKPDGKGRYKNVGVVMEGDKGPYILLERTFNPAGVNVEAGRESLIISMFKPRDEQGQQQQSSRPPADERDEHVPF